ncbi:cutinase family protein [Nocardia sp. NPDC055050]
MARTVAALAVAATVGSGVATFAESPAAAVPIGPGCPALYVLGVQGTGQSSPAADPLADTGVVGALIAPVLRAAPGLVQRSYIPYGAGFGGAVPGGGPDPYAVSVSDARNQLDVAAAEIADTCPETMIAGVGYSQGAQAMSDFAADIGAGSGPIGADRIAGIALYANPDRAPGSPVIAGRPGQVVPDPAPGTSGSAVSPPSPSAESTATPWWKNSAVLGVVGMVGVAVTVLALFRDTLDFKFGSSSAPSSAEMSEKSEGSTVTATLPKCSADYDGARAGWGPDRPTYGANEVAPQPTFNVQRVNPNLGDERNFVGARESWNQEMTWRDDLEVRPGHEYRVRLYLHNSALDHDDYVAAGTSARFDLPTCSGRSIAVFGFVTSDSAFPRQIYDGVVLRSQDEVSIDIVPGSAILESNAHPSSDALRIPDSVASAQGTWVGSQALDGRFRGGYANDAYLTILVAVSKA